MSETTSVLKGDSVKLELKKKKKLKHFKIFYQARLDSFSSLSSIYSADGGQADYSISGSILLGIWHKNDTLFVRVVEAKELAGAKAGGLSDPYVKTNILPDCSKLTKRKTTIDRKTNNPTYNEILKTRLTRFDIDKSTLWVTVWDWDKFGRNLFLGEVRLNLYSMDLTDSEGEKWYRLKEKKSDPINENRGKIAFSVKYSPNETGPKGSLFIKIKEASNLPKMNLIGLADASVRLFLLPNRTPLTKQKTSCAKNTLNPTWNEEFEYKYITLEDLKINHVLELTVWDYDRRGCNDFIGCVRLGPWPNESNVMHNEWMDSTDSEAEDWEKIIDSPDQWVDCCHDLRPIIASRFAVPAHLRDDNLELSDSEDDNSEENDDSLYGSNTSLYSESEMKGDYPITGSLEVKIQHDQSTLSVNILSAKDLAAADSNGLSDPYVNLYLLPKRKSLKRKTKVKLETLNPVFHEIKEYEVEADELFSQTLWFSVWDWDKFGKNLFLGEVRIPLSVANVNAPADYYDLSDNKEVGISPTKVSVGKLTIGLKFQILGSSYGEVYGNLHVHVRNAKDLLDMDTEGYTDGFVKFFLLPSKSSKSQRKTKVINDNLNPTWNERFVYKKVTLEQLSSSHALEFSVWDHNSIWSNEFIGGLRIGPSPKPGETKEWMDSTTIEAGHWEEMLSCPNEWVERCHRLRPTMNYRAISISEKASVLEDDIMEDSVALQQSEEGTTLLEDDMSEPPVPCVEVDDERVTQLKSQTEVSVDEIKNPELTTLKLPDLLPPNHPPSTTGTKTPETESGVPAAAEKDDDDSVFLPGVTVPDISLSSSPDTEPVHHRGSFDISKRQRVPSLTLHPRFTKRSASVSVPQRYEPDDKEEALGYLVISMKFEVSSKKTRPKGSLIVKILEAQQLQCKTKDGVFARCSMLPLSFFSTTKTTKMINNTKNPAWNESYTFGKYFIDEISTDKALEVSLWDINDGSNPLFAGGVRLGPDPEESTAKSVWKDSTDMEIKHWKAIFAEPGEWVMSRHALRPTLNY